MRAGLIRAMAVLAMAGMAFGCSSGDDAPDEGGSTTVTTAQQGPAAEFGEPLDGGEGVRLATSGGGPSLDVRQIR